MDNWYFISVNLFTHCTFCAKEAQRLMQYLHTLRKSGTNVYAICVNLTNAYPLCKMSTKTYTIWKNLTTHWSFCVRILKTVIAVCTQYVWAWVNFVHNLRCLLKNLRSQQKFYATAGPTGPDKYELWTQTRRLVQPRGEEALAVFGPFWPPYFYLMPKENITSWLGWKLQEKAYII